MNSLRGWVTTVGVLLALGGTAAAQGRPGCGGHGGPTPPMTPAGGGAGFNSLAGRAYPTPASQQLMAMQRQLFLQQLVAQQQLTQQQLQAQLLGGAVPVTPLTVAQVQRLRQQQQQLVGGR